MTVDTRVNARREELLKKGISLVKVKEGFHSSDSFTIQVNQWAVSVLSLLKTVFGEGSEHYKTFLHEHSNIRKYLAINAAIGILSVAKDDYSNGYLLNVKQLVTAEVFDDLFEQAEHLLGQGYYQPAAVFGRCCA